MHITASKSSILHLSRSSYHTSSSIFQHVLHEIVPRSSLIAVTRRISPSSTRRKSTTAKANRHELVASVLQSSVTRRDARFFLKDRGSAFPLGLVKLRDTESLSDEVLEAIGQTFSQLVKLGLGLIVVVDSSGEESHGKAWKSYALEQANRVVRCVPGCGARLVDSAVTLEDGIVKFTYDKQIMAPLGRDVIPVIPGSLAYSSDMHTATPVDADNVVLALIREFNGSLSEVSGSKVRCDRLIVLDPVGGIPSEERVDGFHVFLNMLQEYDSIRAFLTNDKSSNNDVSSKPENIFGILHSNSSSSSVVGSISPSTLLDQSGSSVSSSISEDAQPMPPATHSHALQQATRNAQNLKNLDLVRQALLLLPPSSSALITSPLEAAQAARQSQATTSDLGVGTRRIKNLLIHNLLTDKPVFSSSLPPGRILSSPVGDQEPHLVTTRLNCTTFAKKGMPVRIFPDPATHPWEPPSPGTSPLSLKDSQLDLDKLVFLINDSFDRKLDVPAYLTRLKDNLAGVIIAGDYEGGAILTWECPPGIPDDGSPTSRARMVPYLDKFAVLKRSQGSGGVADIVFKAMIRDCFKDGVVWRSRKSNKVNGWYFERSRGTWKMPGTEWTMFWTTKLGPEEEKGRLADFEGVCRSIRPTWADGKAVVD